MPYYFWASFAGAETDNFHHMLAQVAQHPWVATATASYLAELFDIASAALGLADGMSAHQSLTLGNVTLDSAICCEATTICFCLLLCTKPFLYMVATSILMSNCIKNSCVSMGCPPKQSMRQCQIERHHLVTASGCMNQSIHTATQNKQHALYAFRQLNHRQHHPAYACHCVMLHITEQR